MTKTFGDETVGDVNIAKIENSRYSSKDLPHKFFDIMNVSLLEPLACWPLPYQNRDDGCVL